MQILQPLRLVDDFGTFLILPEHLSSPLHFGVEWYTLALGPVQMYTSSVAASAVAQLVANTGASSKPNEARIAFVYLRIFIIHSFMR